MITPSLDTYTTNELKCLTALQGDMLDELNRREAAEKLAGNFKVGDRVQYFLHVDRGGSTMWRLATPADIKAFEARIPQPVVVVDPKRHGGKQVRNNQNAAATLLDAEGQRRMNAGWKAEGYGTTYVWAVYADGRVGGNPAENWRLA